jgi:hypothetical protein
LKRQIDFAAALVDAAGVDPARARARQRAGEEVERQIHRALWRAERRGRRLPFDIRQGASWVNAQRRKIAQELTKAFRSLGAGVEVSRVLCARACERFPRDGVVIAEADPRRPRTRGDAPRQRRANPRATGTSPRQRGQSPRQQRAAAATEQQSAAAIDRTNTVTPSPAPVEQLAPDWSHVKEKILEGLEPHERIRATENGRRAREAVHRSQNPKPSPPAPRS